MEKNKDTKITQEDHPSPEDNMKMIADIESLIVGIVHPPKLLDWLIGLVSIVWGVSLLLSSNTSEYMTVGRFSVWLLPIMTSAIAAGSGLILAEMTSAKIRPIWKRVFLLILAAVFASMALILYRGGDVDGVLIFSLISLVILVLFIAEPGSRLCFMLLVQALFLGLLLLMRYFPFEPDLSYMNRLLTGGIDWIHFVWGFNLLIYIVFAWFGYLRKPQLLSVLIGLSSIPLVLVALVYGNQGQWSKSFVFLMFAVFAVLIPFWEDLKFRYRKHRVLVYRMFFVILTFFVGTAVLIGALQNILISNAKIKLADQVTYGRVLTESTVENGISTVEGLAQNGILINDLQTMAKSGLTEIIASVFAGNRSLHQIIVTDKKGVIILVYPFTTNLEGTDISSKEYFRSAMVNKRTYFSEDFTPDPLLFGSRVLPLSAPVLDAKRNPIGMVIGLFDLQLLSDRLAQVATPNFSEYFALIDQKGTWMINPDFSKVSSLSADADPVRRSLLGRTGVVEGYDASGVLALTAYTQIQRMKWGLVLVQPMFTALSVSQTAYVAILAVACLSAVIIGLTVLPKKSKEEIAQINETK